MEISILHNQSLYKFWSPSPSGLSVIDSFQIWPLMYILFYVSKVRFRRYGFFLTTVACDLLTSRLQHKLCRLNQMYNIFTTVARNTKNMVGF